MQNCSFIWLVFVDREKAQAVVDWLLVFVINIKDEVEHGIEPEDTYANKN